MKFFLMGSLTVALTMGPSAAAGELGGTWERHTIDDTSRGADGVRLADVNGDGLLDIVTPWEEGGVVRVYYNPGPDAVTSAWPRTTVGEVPAPEDAVFFDMDRDGNLDVVSSCEGDTTSMFVHWNPGDDGEWTTEAFPPSQDKMMWMFALPMDVNGDGREDLVAGGKGGGAELGWFEAPENGRDLKAWTWHTIRPLGWLMGLIAVDVDKDGDDDIAFTDRKREAQGMFWIELPSFKEHRASPKPHDIAAERQYMFFDYGQLIGDENEDFVVADIDGGVLMYAGPEWTPEVKLSIEDTIGAPKGVGVGDMNLDGRNDFVMSCEHADGKFGVVVGVRADDGFQIVPISGHKGTKYDLVQLIDLDQDGDLDVLTCEERENLGVIWYENPVK